MTRSVPRSLGWSVGWSVCHNFLKGREVTLPCSNRNTCYLLRLTKKRGDGVEKDTTHTKQKKMREHNDDGMRR